MADAVHGRCCAWQMLCLKEQLYLVKCAWQMLCLVQELCLVRRAWQMLCLVDQLVFAPGNVAELPPLSIWLVLPTYFSPPH